MSNAIPETPDGLRCHIAATAPIRQSPMRGKSHTAACHACLAHQGRIMPAASPHQGWRVIDVSLISAEVFVPFSRIHCRFVQRLGQPLCVSRIADIT
ncbi:MULTISPECIES: hypothetical protein [unclassified Mesorhizobium]|uniref:hypothetical protein n=1 Tax=unclassified Mesorhizobium TaxID=325217 RepID=UPI000FE8D1E2|nr:MULTISPECIES: hypothetical protein [unclassified Mesorhizobium]RWK47736.1 MAG: hypothetical protein EOR47_21045 [Mesorhizobium sp.]RWK95596.1 MAG: hypothetical protein EOR53_13140 [Mesorhizobium sp.]RWL01772.1 MAG: hypothetical protein EOR45_17125 [Mesorhizobium sp.]TIP56010.1 MAG: hypothetical protein E5X56_26405 [Mesorhizobium sp.]TIP96593.1 MAG: hypothetical protein E5X60_20005 [Mesorhizobium sp.]